MGIGYSRARRMQFALAIFAQYGSTIVFSFPGQKAIILAPSTSIACHPKRWASYLLATRLHWLWVLKLCSLIVLLFAVLAPEGQELFFRSQCCKLCNTAMRETNWSSLRGYNLRSRVSNMHDGIEIYECQTVDDARTLIKKWWRIKLEKAYWCWFPSMRIVHNTPIAS